MTDRDELVKLRVSVARIAQVAGLGDMIPGVTPDEAGESLPYQRLHALAQGERGWNLLSGLIVTRLEEHDEALRWLAKRVRMLGDAFAHTNRPLEGRATFPAGEP